MASLFEVASPLALELALTSAMCAGCPELKKKIDPRKTVVKPTDNFYS
ncbi:hypothetical protein ODV19_00005 [Lactobacillus amylovorus]|nr:hypothetical protein [Lactobacillus amylovorus]